MPVRTSRSRRVGRVVALASASVILATCGSEEIPSTALPAQVPGFRSAAFARIDADRLAAEAIDRQELAGVLDAAGFASAVERSYTSTRPENGHIEAVLMRFDSGDGAARYLDWLGDHVSDIIGDAQIAPEQDLDGIPVYVHHPDGCCPKEQVVALAVWQDGRYVARALVAGPDADGPQTAQLLSSIRAGISTDA